MAVPPADSPSTSSSSVGRSVLNVQSRSFAGNPLRDLLPLPSKARTAACSAFDLVLDRIDEMARSAIFFAGSGFSSSQRAMAGMTIARVRDVASGFISFDFEFPANCGPGSMIEATIRPAAKMSRVFGCDSLSFNMSRSPMYFWTDSVTAVRNPLMCVPPSGVATPFANPMLVSRPSMVQAIAASSVMSPSVPWNDTTGATRPVSAVISVTRSATPPFEHHSESSLAPLRLSMTANVTPG